MLSHPAQRTEHWHTAMGRRQFIQLLLGWSLLSTLALVATPLIAFLLPGRSSQPAGGLQLVGRGSEIGLDHGFVTAVGSHPVIVLRRPDGLRAFSAVCTHLGCIVGFDAAQGPDILCSCHDGHFSAANGSVISGPPPAPLFPVPVSLEGDQLFVEASWGGRAAGRGTAGPREHPADAPADQGTPSSRVRVRASSAPHHPSGRTPSISRRSRSCLPSPSRPRPQVRPGTAAATS